MFKSSMQKTMELNVSTLLLKLNDLTPGTEEYETILANIERLNTMLSDNQKQKISPDVKATVAANLIGIGMIVGHERAGVVTSKALGFVQKLR